MPGPSSWTASTAREAPSRGPSPSRRWTWTVDSAYFSAFSMRFAATCVMRSWSAWTWTGCGWCHDVEGEVAVERIGLEALHGDHGQLAEVEHLGPNEKLLACSLARSSRRPLAVAVRGDGALWSG